MLSKEPYILSKDPYILSKEPYILSKEPYILSKKPYILSKEPCIPSKEPHILSKESSLLSKDPYTLSKELYIPSKDIFHSIFLKFLEHPMYTPYVYTADFHWSHGPPLKTSTTIKLSTSQVSCAVTQLKHARENWVLRDRNTQRSHGLAGGRVSPNFLKKILHALKRALCSLSENIGFF